MSKHNDPIPAGRYYCQIERASEKHTRSGSLCWDIKFEVVDGPQAGKTVRDSIYFTEKAKPRAIALGLAVGLEIVNNRLTVSPELIVGKTCYVIVSIETTDKGSHNKVVFNGFEAAKSIPVDDPQEAASVPATNALSPIADGIPLELRERSQWVCWRSEVRKHERTGELKRTKVPKTPGGENASSTDNASWSTFEAVMSAYARGGFEGIGFVFSVEDPYVGIDFDKALDDSGQVKEWAHSDVLQLRSYTELSPSGNGFHVIARGKLPGKGRKWGFDDHAVEAYDHSRYFTFTGRRVEAVIGEVNLAELKSIEDRPAQVQDLYERYDTERTKKKPKAGSEQSKSSAPPPPPSGASLSDEKILELARRARNGLKFDRLWNGSIDGYASQSEADAALASMLAFFTGPDPGRIDALFRRSALMREKWDEVHGAQTYGAGTIDFVLTGAREFYKPHKAYEPPDLSVLDELVEKAEADPSVLDAESIIEALAYLKCTKPGEYEGLARDLRKAKIRLKAFEPRVNDRARAIGAAIEDAEDNQGPKDDVQWISDCGKFGVVNGRFAQYVEVSQGDSVASFWQPIANFSGKVVEDITRDDGCDERKVFIVDGAIANGTVLGQREIAASQFDGLSWMPGVWGPEPSAMPKRKEHTAYAFRLFSGRVARRTIYCHLGFRQAGDDLIYLHAGGALGATGVEVDVASEGLGRYVLPAESSDARAAMEVSLRFLSAGDPRVMYSAWALPWRAAVCEFLLATVMPHWVGGTGKLKSSLAAALLGHHGDFRTKEDLPGRWEFTDNILEKGSFLAKDVVFVIDDLNPESTRMRREELERRFSRIAGSVGNATGRRRMTSQLKTRLEYHPRGVVLSTGEYTATLASSRMARLFIVPFTDGSVDPKKLGEIQQDVGALPYAMRAFIEHVRSQRDGFRQGLAETFQRHREQAVELRRHHSRLPENVAHIYLGLELGLAFAVTVGALDEVAAGDHLARGWQALHELAEEQGRLIGEERPVAAFLGSIAEALAQGRAWLARPTDGDVVSGDAGVGSEKLGWADDDGIYLLPTASYRFVTTRLEHRGGVQVSDRALHKQLDEEGYLVRSAAEPDRLTTRKFCESVAQRIICLVRTAITLPPARSKHTSCYSCKSPLTPRDNTRCPDCHWLVCDCGACGCGRKEAWR